MRGSLLIDETSHSRGPRPGRAVGAPLVSQQQVRALVRPPPAAASRRAMAPGRRDHRRAVTRLHAPSRMNSRNRPDDRKETPPGPADPAHPGATAGHRPHQEINPSRTLQAADHQRERSRLTVLIEYVSTYVALSSPALNREPFSSG